MATAKEERELVAHGKGCLGKAADDEPVFILRGQDFTSAALVRLWADIARITGCPQHKIDEAIDLASKMDEWEHRKWPD